MNICILYIWNVPIGIEFWKEILSVKPQVQISQNVLNGACLVMPYMEYMHFDRADGVLY